MPPTRSGDWKYKHERHALEGECDRPVKQSLKYTTEDSEKRPWGRHFGKHQPTRNQRFAHNLIESLWVALGVVEVNFRKGLTLPDITNGNGIWQHKPLCLYRTQFPHLPLFLWRSSNMIHWSVFSLIRLTCLLRVGCVPYPSLPDTSLGWHSILWARCIKGHLHLKLDISLWKEITLSKSGSFYAIHICGLCQNQEG